MKIHKKELTDREDPRIYGIRKFIPIFEWDSTRVSVEVVFDTRENAQNFQKREDPRIFGISIITPIYEGDLTNVTLGVVFDTREDAFNFQKFVFSNEFVSLPAEKNEEALNETKKYSAGSYIPKKVSGKRKISNSTELADLVREVIGEDMQKVEQFVIVTVDGGSNVIRAEMLYRGTLNHSVVHPRDVFRVAIEDNSAGVLLAHNRPSGELIPSGADERITSRLKDVGKMVGIDLVDHLIISNDGHYSFDAEGLL